MLVLAKSAVHTTKSCLSLNPFHQKMREFKSLEANIGPLCLSSESNDICITDETLISKHEVSASLPNLACICLEQDQSGGCLVEANNCNNTKSPNVPIANIYNKIISSDNYSQPFDQNTERIDYIVTDQGQSKSIEESNSSDVCENCKKKSEEELSSNMCNVENSQTTCSCQHNNDTNSVLSYESTDNLPMDDNFVTGRVNSNTDVDLIKDDELTLLKDSPRSSPGNTLDSGNCSLGRTDSFGKTDASSFSSVSSISTGIESAINETDIREESVNSDTDVTLQCPSSETDPQISKAQETELDPNLGVKLKRKSLTFGSFLTRNLFSRKGRESDSCNATGWRLFGGSNSGKVPVKPVTTPEPVTSSTANSDASSVTSAELAEEGRKMKKTDIEVLSTTALILEHRPEGLPCKDPEEEQRHKLQYEQMVEAVKKKEVREAKARKKAMQQQLRHEDEMAAAAKIWSTELLCSWETMHNCKKARDMWWNGIPPSVRGKVWRLAFGNDLNLTKDLYHICLNRAKERLKLIEDWCGDTDSICSHMSGFSDHSASREASVELIKLDVSRTFPQLCIFQKGGPYHELLQGLLGAYACYRPDVGYVQGMSFIAAVLLLNMEVQDAFICFANLLNQPCQIAFFRLDEYLMKAYFETYEEFFEENLPQLYEHFKKFNITPDLYIIDWMFTLYAKSLPLDIASRVWDVFARDGEEFLFRTALGILKLYEDILIQMDFIHLAQFLTRLPENIQADELFACLERIRMCIDTRRFKDVLVCNRDAIREPSSYSSYS